MSTNQLRSRLVGSLWIATWLGLASVLTYFGLAGSDPIHHRSPVEADFVSANSPLTAKQIERPLQAIEDVRIGDRVHVDISEYQRDLARGRIGGRDWDTSEYKIDPTCWRAIELSMEGTDGDQFEIDLLRPTDWFEASGAAVGKQIQLSIPEQGLNGPALVLAIHDCPVIAGGQGRTVTGAFTHVRGGILHVHVEGISDPVGVTGNHPVFSVTENDFVLASTLSAGDTVQLLDRRAKIERIEKVAGEQRVFNLEVHGDHVYHVTSEGMLVHNASEHGSYTVSFSDGTVYHGKGSGSRSEVSAKREVSRHNNDPANANNQISHTASDWKPASSQREAFKAEARRIDADKGVESSTNRNRINSPGRKYIHQDGDTTVY